MARSGHKPAVTNTIGRRAIFAAGMVAACSAWAAIAFAGTGGPPKRCAASAARATPAVSPAALKAFRALLPRATKLDATARGDLNNDGRADVAAVGRPQSADGPAVIYVAFARSGSSQADLAIVSKGPVEHFAPDPVDLTIVCGVLKVEIETGGTARSGATYTLRYEPLTRRIRLIGFDSLDFDRTMASDLRTASWNLMTGATTREIAKVIPGTTEFDAGTKRRGKRPSKPVYLEQLPTPDALGNMIPR